MNQTYAFHILPLLYNYCIEQINAVKGHFHIILHVFLFKPNKSLLQASCICNKNSLFGYEKTLYDLNIWLLEQIVYNTTMSTILDHFNEFMYKVYNNAYIFYQKNYTKIV